MRDWWRSFFAWTASHAVGVCRHRAVTRVFLCGSSHIARRDDICASARSPERGRVLRCTSRRWTLRIQGRTTAPHTRPPGPRGAPHGEPLPSLCCTPCASIRMCWAHVWHATRAIELLPSGRVRCDGWVPGFWQPPILQIGCHCAGVIPLLGYLVAILLTVAAALLTLVLLRVLPSTGPLVSSPIYFRWPPSWSSPSCGGAGPSLVALGLSVILLQKWCSHGAFSPVQAVPLKL